MTRGILDLDQVQHSAQLDLTDYQSAFIGILAEGQGLIRVAWSLVEDTFRSREMRALDQAMEELGLDESVLVTAAESETVRLDPVGSVPYGYRPNDARCMTHAVRCLNPRLVRS